MLATLYITGLTGITTRYLLHTKNRNNVFDETQQARVLEVVRISAGCHPRNFNSKVLAFLELQIFGLKHGNFLLFMEFRVVGVWWFNGFYNQDQNHKCLCSRLNVIRRMVVRVCSVICGFNSNAKRDLHGELKSLSKAPWDVIYIIIYHGLQTKPLTPSY